KIELSRSLVRLDTKVSIDTDFTGWRLRDWQAPRLLKLFKEWGFRGFADSVRREGPGVTPQESEEANLEQQPDVQGELFPFGENAPLAQEKAPEPVVPAPRTAEQLNYRLVDTAEKLKHFLQELRRQKRFAMDLET